MQVMAIVFLGVLLTKKGFIDNDNQRVNSNTHIFLQSIGLANTVSL